MTAADRRARWLDWSERFQTTFESIDDEGLASLQVRLSFFPEPLNAAGLGGMRLTEQSLHSWDIFSPFDDAAVIAESSAELIIDRLSGMMRWAGKADRWQRGPLRVAVTTSNPTRALQLAVGEAVTLDPGDADAEAALTLSSETFIRLVTGRLREPDTPGVTIDGALSLDDLRQLFPGF